MHLHFENLHEFHDMAAAMGYVKRDTVTIDMRVNADDIAASVASMTSVARFVGEPRGSGTESEQQPEQQPDGGINPAYVNVPISGEKREAAEPVRRKRRTKAEIEAAKAAETADVAATPVDPFNIEAAAPANPLDNLKSEDPAAGVAAQADSARAEITTMAALYDGNDKLAHLNEGRQFIEKYGFPIYNETFQLAEVPSNIAAHAPEQVSRHRAAMAWVHAQKQKG